MPRISGPWITSTACFDGIFVPVLSVGRLKAARVDPGAVHRAPGARHQNVFAEVAQQIHAISTGIWTLIAIHTQDGRYRRNLVLGQACE